MSARILVTLAAAVLWSGCSSVGTISTQGDESALREVNRAVHGKVVRVDLREGQRLHVVGLRVEADSVTWIDRKSNTLESLPTSSIRQVSIHKTGSGALRGLLVGAVVGAAAGGVRATMEGDDPLDDPLAITREEKLRIFPAAHAVYATLVTTPIGAIIGTRKVYRFNNEGFPSTVSTR